jgi:ribonuclease Z
MRAVILGTASAFPTRERAHSATFLDIGTEALLFDCGESVQRQMTFARLSPMKISKIFITHWHGDHVLGLGGLLQSMQLNQRKKPVDIYGPEETRQRFNYMMKAFEFRTQYPINVYEVKASQKPFKILDKENYEVWAIRCRHPLACLAFSYVEKPRRRIDIKYLKKFGLVNDPIIKNLQTGKDIMWKGKKIAASKATYMQKGKKFAYIVDAGYSENLIGFAKDADVLICEATFTKDLGVEAREFGHMTAADAAMLAKKANAKQLVITHFSQRYRDASVLLAEARKVFKNTIAARDFMEIKI